MSAIYFFFLSIVECDAALDCNDQGLCGKDGSCECDWGFFMDDCSSKLRKCYFVLKIVLVIVKNF